MTRHMASTPIALCRHSARGLGFWDSLHCTPDGWHTSCMRGPGDRSKPHDGVFRAPLWHRLVAAGAFLLIAGAAARSALDVSGILVGLSVLVVLAALWAAWRAWRLRIVADDDGVLIVNWRNTRRLPWQSIQRFDWENGLAVELRDGDSETPDVFGPWNVPMGGQFDLLIATTGRQLQDELRRRRG